MAKGSGKQITKRRISSWIVKFDAFFRNRNRVFEL